MSSGSAETVDSVFKQYVQEQHFWKAVAEATRGELTLLARHARIRAETEARAKTLGSVVGKLYRKPDRYRQLADFRDLAGARVIVPFVSDVDPMAAAIGSHPSLDIITDETKVPQVAELSYQARHLDVQLLDDLVPSGWPTDFERRPALCEIQIQTFAQNLWANTSHLVTYKRTLPADIERRITRLIALCEIFDSESEQARDLALQSTDVIGSVADDLVRYFLALTGVGHDVDTTLAVVAMLYSAVADNERDTYRDRIETFVDQHAERLGSLLTSDPGSHGIPMLVRPEILFVLERLSNAQMSLERVWSESFPEADLGAIARAWGPE